MSSRGRKKKRDKRAGQSSGLDRGLPADPRAMEGTLSDITRHLEEQDFESIEEVNDYLTKMLESGEGPPAPSRPATQLEKAQEVVYQAFEATGKKRAQLARKALRVSKDCADAYVLLAEETAKNPQEARELYQKGVEAGERALGPEAFEEDEGHFWVIFETRPYMRARHGLALALWASGERQEAVGHYQEMLRLNPNDNQGVRYLLAQTLLEEGDDEALKDLLERYEDDASAVWTYTGALLAFREHGASEKANAAIEEALETNPFVPAYMLGQKNLPRVLPEYIGFGDDSEAVSYVADAMPTWLRTPGALEWLREHAADVEPSEDTDPWNLDEDEEEIIAALAAEEEAAAGLLREALSEHRGAESPSAELRAAAGRMREGISGDDWPYERMMAAAGWEANDLPADDAGLWLGCVGGMFSPRQDTDLTMEEESSIMAVQHGGWLGAVIGLVRAGAGAPASPEDLVSYINESPEIEGEIDPDDATLVRRAFELALPGWEAAGAVDDRRRLTALGRWGLPRALAWAWDHDFDTE